MNKQILINYTEYLELVNSKKQYEDNLKLIKEVNKLRKENEWWIR